MQISVLTPDRTLFTGSIESVTVPGTNGNFQILNNHAPIVSALGKGTVQLVTDAGEHEVFNAESGKLEKATNAGRTVTYKVSGGFVEVLKNEVSLLLQGVS